jgi:ribA/ribD-fused uncharacterized protein
MTIYFYQEKIKTFSNFSLHSFWLDDHEWKTSEHYFQAQKFVNTEHFNTIKSAKTPLSARILGRSRKFPIREDWEEVKDDVMRKALYAKFSQNKDIKNILVSTDNTKLIENSPNDYYWGCGFDNSGLNRLGVLLMELRTLFQLEDF